MPKRSYALAIRGAGTLARAYKRAPVYGIKNINRRYIAAKAIQFAWRNRKRIYRATARSTKRLKKVAKKVVESYKEAFIHAQYLNNESVDTENEPDDLKVYLPLIAIPKSTDTGVKVDQGRTGTEINMKGFRIHYCIKRRGWDPTAVPRTDNVRVPDYYLRVMLVEDKFGRDNLGEEINMFSGVGNLIANNDIEDYQKAALDFSQITPKCTKFVQPLNSRRYRIIWQRKIKVSGYGNPFHDWSRVGKWWIPYNKTVKFGSMGASASTEYTTPQVKFLWWYNSSFEGNTDEALRLDMKWLTYFKNK